MCGQLVDSLSQLHWDVSRDNPGFDWADHDGSLLRNEEPQIVVHYDGPLGYCRVESSLVNQMS